jgi:hypothetical protein
MPPVTSPVTRQIAQFGVQPSRNFAYPPCSAASFELNSEPHTGARPSVRLCVGLIKGSVINIDIVGLLLPAIVTKTSCWRPI